LAILTGTQLPSYDHTKYLLLNLGWSWVEEGFGLHVMASMVAGVMEATGDYSVDFLLPCFDL
jgi:hypothetical protein